MPRLVSWKATALLLLLACLAPALAQAAVVPDDYPSIQAAIDAGADVVEIRDGLAPERLHVSHSVVIRAKLATTPYVSVWFATPHVRSLDVTSDEFVALEVHDVRFLGNVTTDHFGGYNDAITFEGCRFDSSLVGIGSDFSKTSMRHCMIVGSVDLRGYVQFVGNTVIGGTATIWADGAHDIRDNYIQGPSTAGLDLSLQDSGGLVDMNTIRGTTDGIIYHSSGWLSRNDIANCSGDGIHFIGGYVVTARADSNTISDCGGAGIRVETGLNSGHNGAGAGVNGNRIQRTGQEGMRLTDAIVYSAIGNTILDSGRDGMVAGLGGNVRGNVIGRSNGDGLILTEEPYSVVGNTFFSNSGVGFRFAGATSIDSVQRNISAFNGGAGVVSTDGQAPFLGCNDWFGNAAGSVVGIAAGSSDLSVNPLFCNLGAGDVHLSSESPLASSPGCGLIGALGIGCGAVTAVPSQESSAPLTFAAWPVPSRGAVAFSIPRSGLPAEIEVFDLAGARRWQSTIPAGASRLSWTGHDSSGGPTPPGVYFARLRQGGREIARTRIVLTR